MNEISINTEIIKLDAFLKWAAIVGSGAEAKFLIQDGLVSVNGETCIQRGKKLKKGDIVSFDNIDYKIM
jgi:ribosome-associated protein